MQYREVAPPPKLRPYVTCLWTLAGDGRGAPPQRVLPDGSVELVLHLGDPFHRLVADRLHQQPRALIVGDVARPILLCPGTQVDLIGARFRPGAAGAVLGAPPAAILGEFHDLHDLQVPSLRDLLERIGNTERNGRLAALATALEAALARARPPVPRLLHGLGAIAAAHGRLSLPALAESLGWSQRQLERQVRGTLGMSPKRFARLRRFQWVVSQLSPERPPSWTRLAFAAGYHDQSHLVREFREFAGTTPAAWWRDTHPMADLFLAGVDFLQEPPTSGS